MTRLRPAIVIVTLALAGVACGRDGGANPLARALDRVRPPSSDSLAALRAEIEYLRAVSDEKDTLLVQVRETQEFIGRIDEDLARAVGPGVDLVTSAETDAARDPQELLREGIRGRLRELAERLTRSEAEARERAERVKQLAAAQAVDRRRITELDSSLASFREIVRGQREQIATLIQRVDTLERENAALAAERDVLVDSVTRLVARDDSVFVRAGSREELLRLGVAVEDGGTRVPLVGYVGRALVPARAQDGGQFTPLDRRRDTVIELPDPARAYRIVSPHDPALLDPAQPGNAVVRGRLRVADPERFWAQSRYLLLVEVK